MREGWREGVASDFVQINPRVIGVTAQSPFVTMADVSEWGRWAGSSGPKGDRGGIRAGGGDTLMARITPCLENGKIAQIPRDMGPLGGSTEFIVLRAGQGVHPDFVLLWAQQRKTHSGAVGRMIGTSGRQRVSAHDVGALPMLLPPLREQERIVDLIASLDDTIAKAALQVNALRDVRINTAAALPGILVPLRDVLLGIQAGRSPSGVERIPGLGERAVLKVSAIGPDGFVPEEVKVVSPDEPLPPATAVSQGDVLLVRASGAIERVGITCRVDADYPQLFLCDKTLRLVPDPTKLDSYWLDAALTTASARAQLFGLTTGSDMRNISQRAILQVEIPVPQDPDELAIFSAVLQANAKAFVLAKQMHARLVSLRSNLLTALLSGEHEIPESYDELMEVSA